MTAPLGSVPVTVKPDETVEAAVVIQSKNIGHSLIPEVRDLYEAWVKVTVADAAGNMLYRSGFLKPDGLLDTGAHSFTNRPVDLTGNFVDNHKVWPSTPSPTTTPSSPADPHWSVINSMSPPMSMAHYNHGSRRIPPS